MRFLVDEDVFVCLKFILDEWGHDADAVQLVGLQGSSDQDVLSHAVNEQRVIVTFNTNDFEQLHEECQEQGRDHPGIVVCQQQDGYENFGRMLRWMRAMLETVGPARFANTILYLHTFQ